MIQVRVIGNKNFGFGVCFYANSSGDGWINIEKFKKYGINIKDQKYQSYGAELDVEIVDKVEDDEIAEKRKDIDDLFKKNGITLETYQIDALINVAYRCGNFGGQNTVDLYKKYYLKGDKETFQNSVYSTGNNVSFFVPTGEAATRKKNNWILFSTGKYIGGDGKEIVVKETGTGNNKIISKAKEIKKYMVDNKYVYDQSGLAITFEKSKNTKTVCCATFVSWVLQEAGYLSDSEHTNYSGDIETILNKKGWKKIGTNISKAKPGDVLVYGSDHTEIYAGNNRVYNAGATEHLRTYDTTRYFHRSIFTNQYTKST